MDITSILGTEIHKKELRDRLMHGCIVHLLVKVHEDVINSGSLLMSSDICVINFIKVDVLIKIYFKPCTFQSPVDKPLSIIFT